MLKGLRFQKRLKLLPGWRNDAPGDDAPSLSKNAVVIPGLVSRRKPAPRHRGLLIGVAALLAGLVFSGWQNRDGIADWFAPEAAPMVQAAAPAPAPMPPSTPTASTTKAKPLTIAAQRAKLLVPGGVIYVRRGGSVLREAQKPSAAVLARLEKGAAVTVVAMAGPWTQVKNGGITGWMRTSVLGPKP
jgi:hypothetical protein